MVRCQNGFLSNRCDDEDANDDDGAIAADGGALPMLPLAVVGGGWVAMVVGMVRRRSISIQYMYQ